MTNTTINDKGNRTVESSVLQYLIKEPPMATETKKAIMLLHGVGSNEADLFSLAAQLPKEFYVIAPRGPFILGAGKYAWYQVDFSTGKPVINAKQEETSRGLIWTFLNQVKVKYGIDEVYLGGFSQGAIMSYSIGLTHPEAIDGIIAFSGRLLDEIKPLVKKNAYLLNKKVFIAHGIQDQMLPIEYANQAKNYLEQLGLSVTYHQYPIGHQISSQVLNDLNGWLL